MLTFKNPFLIDPSLILIFKNVFDHWSDHRSVLFGMPDFNFFVAFDCNG